MAPPEKTKEEKRQELIDALKANEGGEEGHMHADALLLRYIGDEEISNAFYAIENIWYS